MRLVRDEQGLCRINTNGLGVVLTSLETQGSTLGHRNWGLTCYRTAETAWKNLIKVDGKWGFEMRFLIYYKKNKNI